MADILMGILVVFVAIVFTLYCILLNKQRNKTDQERRIDIINNLKKLEKELDTATESLVREDSFSSAQRGAVRKWKKQMSTRIQDCKAEEEHLSVNQLDRMLHILENDIQGRLEQLSSADSKNRHSFFEKESSSTGKIVNFILYTIFLGLAIYCYLIFTATRYGILAITCVLGYALFPDNLLSKSKYEKITRKCILDTGCFMAISFFGFLFNQWTYVQPEMTQIAITVILPIFYGIIYYAKKHKKRVREL